MVILVRIQGLSQLDQDDMWESWYEITHERLGQNCASGRGAHSSSTLAGRNTSGSARACGRATRGQGAGCAPNVSTVAFARVLQTEEWPV